jgi:hypothetical protein
MELHPAFVTPETEAWFRGQLAALGPIKPVETYLGRDLPTRLGAWLLLNRASMIFDYRTLHGPALDERERRARDVAELVVTYKLPRDETRYAAHLVATGDAAQLVALHHEITGTNGIALPEVFTEDYLDQFQPAEDDDEPLPFVPSRHPRIARRSHGVPFL